MTMKQTGLTLIELIVTLAVVSVLLVMGIPQFKSTTANSRLTTTINTLTGDLSFARTEAIKRATNVAVTASNNDWTNGWTTSVTISGATETIRISPALTAGMTIVTNPANTGTVTYTGDGRTSTIDMTLCDDRSGSFGKKLSITTSGQSFLDVKQTCPVP